MSKSRTTAILALVCILGGNAYAQQSLPVAGKSSLGIAATQMDVVMNGWSAKKSILDKAVYNEENQRIGKIEDIIVAPDNSISFAIIGAGGFLGVATHNVAIPVEQLQLDDKNRFVLPGATKQALKDLPKFEYSSKK